MKVTVDPLDRLERLAARARQEQGETLPGVAPGVLRRLSQTQAPIERPLALFTLGSSVVAMAVLILGVNLLDAISDPLWVMFWMIPGLYY